MWESLDLEGLVQSMSNVQVPPFVGRSKDANMNHRGVKEHLFLSRSVVGSFLAAFSHHHLVRTNIVPRILLDSTPMYKAVALCM